MRIASSTFRGTALLAVTALAPSLSAQWYSLPYNASGQLQASDWYVTHDTGSGLKVFSAIAQRWDTLSPAGAIYQNFGDLYVVTLEGGTTLRGWSALTNESATQTVSASISLQTGPASSSYAVWLDNAPGTFGVLRAYSAFTNTWASKPLSALPVWTIVTGTHAAVQLDGLSYYAYSAYTGQWTTMTVPVAGGVPIGGSDYCAVDLQGTSGPRQYAAFSAPRGAWSTSPTYAAAGAQRVQALGASAFAIRLDTATAGQFQYSGYSPFTGQWVTSSLVHNTASSQIGTAFKNGVRIQDSDPSARYELFGAGNGVWQSLTGTSLTEESLHEDFHVVRQTIGFSTTVYAASTLVGGGYTSVVVPDLFAGVSLGTHQCIVTGGSSTNQAWGYTPATNTFTGPIPQPNGSGVSQAAGAAVGGFNLQGSSAFGTTAKAFSARWGDWKSGPAISPTETWNTYASNGLVATIRSFPSIEMHVFDEHRDAWVAPPAGTPVTWRLAPCGAFVDLGGGTWWGYSVHRGTWTQQTGIGAITSGGGIVNGMQNLAWFTDSNNLIRVFASPARTQSWWQWPLSGAYAHSGSTPGGSTPYVGVSARGASPQYGLLYASLALPPAPISIPGIAGTLDLDAGGAVQLADLGLFDADGVRQVRVPFAGNVPPSTRLWLQLVTVDLLTGQIEITDRSTGTIFF